MEKKILIIDDSALMRRVLSDIINADNRFKVEAMAANGMEALGMMVADKNRFDAILLDINMPKMNGIEFLEQLKIYNMKTKVIVVSTIAKEGAKETIRALELGAFDFVTKPSSFLEAKKNDFQNTILNCLVYAVGLDGPVETDEILKEIIPVNKVERERNKNGSKLVALACSTGGPKALQEIIPFLPENLDAPILIVQHMPEGFTNSLAQRLDELSRIHVKEVEDNEILEKGTVYIAKGGSHMQLKKCANGIWKLAVTHEPARGGLRPCADIMYESLVDSEYDLITCVILTGMGSDGTRGIKQLQETKNIYVIAQNEETCTVYGMPKVIAEAGLVNEVVPLNEIASAIKKNVGVQ